MLRAPQDVILHLTVILLLTFASANAAMLEVCGRGRQSGTVGAMDGAIEPPWMGLRRVPHCLPRPHTPR
ncbi:hypothetical protein CR156_15135 [Stenotrophomonas lactitubi]|nr:hypothetical protein CR156_15135 [Stenotrophomonas lactitubi]